MKIGVVTVNESLNCGSYLQAYALQKTLVNVCDGEVVFLKNHRSSKNQLWYKMLQSLKFVCEGKASLAKHLLKVHTNFRKAKRAFKIIKAPKSIDAMVYGSDTIWNVNHPYFDKHWKRFWGVDYDGKKISYAASIDSTPVQKLLERKEIISAVLDFSAISVRDDNTENFVRQVLPSEQKIYRVIDPTMLLDADEYGKIAPEIEDKGYILFYYFGAIPENVKEQVRAFARKTGRKIVVFGSEGGYADKYISNDPFLMLSYYKNADYVITNTFHGNVFSLIFNKQFISFGGNKKKVKSLLSEFCQDSRLAEENDDLSNLFDTVVDFGYTNAKIKASREASVNYLKNTLCQG